MRIVKSQFGTIAFAAVGIALACGRPACAQTAEHYQNFNSAIYVAIDTMQRMASDPKYMQDSFDVVHAHIKFNKVWLETYRWNQEISEADVRKVKQFFENKGIQNVRRQHGCFRSAGRWDPFVLLVQSRAPRAHPKAGRLDGEHLRRTHLRRPVHV
jgi:hypothetical protein